MIDPNDPGTLDLVAACEEPLSGAERARRCREKKKLQGVKAISLTHTDRCVLSLGLLAHEDLDHRPKDWATTKKLEFDALLKKLWPEGDNGRYLAEPKRSTYRPTAWLRDQLAREQGEKKRLREALDQIAAEVGGSPAPLVSRGEVESLAERLVALEKENALLEAERNKAHAAVDVYVSRLRNAGLSTDYRRQPGE